MIVVGLMSGTSADAIDVAAADIERDGEVLHLRPLGATTRGLPDDVRALLVETIGSGSAALEDVCRLHAELGRAFAAAAQAGVTELAEGRAELVASHGQTLHHLVEGQTVVGSLQVADPARIAEATGLPVVSDLRARDIAAGGQGAPLVALVDVLLLAGDDRAQAALNLGGIANVTVVAPERDPIAFDVGPANALLDAAARRYLDADHDEDGAAAAAGKVDPDLLQILLEEPYLGLPPPKSTGKELFGPGYLDAALERNPVDSGEDVLATLVVAVSRSVAMGLGTFAPSRVVVSGGGVRNPTLMAALTSELSGATVVRSDDLGLSSDAKEAYAFAVLGHLTWHATPGNLPSATGAEGARVLGSITPGSDPLDLPPPNAEPPTRLAVSEAG